MPMTIGEAAKRSGCPAPTIRYYESIGLLAPAARTSKGRRSFGFPDVSRLNFIRRCRGFGLSLDDVRTLLAASESEPAVCAPARALVSGHLEALRVRRAELRLLETALERMVARCDEGCGRGAGNEPCSIFDDISADTKIAARPR